MRGRAAILGAGSWGTAFAKVLADAGRDVVLCARRTAVAAAIREQHVNPDYLPALRLPDRVTATVEPHEALHGADLVVLGVPAQTLRDNLTDWGRLISPDATLVSLAKGIELGTLKRMSEVIVETAGVEPDRVTVVTGPNLSAEIAAEQPTATVVACRDPERAELVQRSIATRYFRPYTNSDVIGCELGGAVKNVIALAYGMAHALGFGDNTRATLITRGLAETARLGHALGANPLTFAGLAGLGDLVATCASPLSRNRTFGEHLAHKLGVEMPITEQVELVCHEGASPKHAVMALMSRDMKSE